MLTCHEKKIFVTVNVYICMFHLRHNARAATNVGALFCQRRCLVFGSLLARGSPTTLVTHVDHVATTKLENCTLPRKVFCAVSFYTYLSKIASCLFCQNNVIYFLKVQKVSDKSIQHFHSTMSNTAVFNILGRLFKRGLT